MYRLTYDQAICQIQAKSNNSRLNYSNVKIENLSAVRPPSWIWSEVDFHNFAAPGPLVYKLIKWQFHSPYFSELGERFVWNSERIYVCHWPSKCTLRFRMYCFCEGKGKFGTNMQEGWKIRDIKMQEKQSIESHCPLTCLIRITFEYSYDPYDETPL